MARIPGYITMYLKIIFGALVFAAGFSFFTYPNGIVSGGVGGVAMTVNYLCGVPVGVMTVLINLPLFAFAWKSFGIAFMVSSFAGMSLSSVFIDIFNATGFAVSEDMLLCAVFGGVFQGLGLGIVYSASATTGGVDILAKVLRSKYQHINFSTFMLLLDLVIISVFAVVFSAYDSSMYALIAIFISTRLIDFVLFGSVNSKVCYIISRQEEQLRSAISDSLGRGITLLQGRGGWSGERREVILCVVRRSQIVGLKKLVHAIDPGAFMFACDTREVFGEGFASIADID